MLRQRNLLFSHSCHLRIIFEDFVWSKSEESKTRCTARRSAAKEHVLQVARLLERLVPLIMVAELVGRQRLELRRHFHAGRGAGIFKPAASLEGAGILTPAAAPGANDWSGRGSEWPAGDAAGFSSAGSGSEAAAGFLVAGFFAAFDGEAFDAEALGAADFDFAAGGIRMRCAVDRMCCAIARLACGLPSGPGGAQRRPRRRATVGRSSKLDWIPKRCAP